MNSTHAHLLLNHFPVIGTLIGVMILLYGLLIKNINIQKVSLATIVVMTLIAIPVFLTGEPAEEAVENLPGVAESIIESHEEAAEVAFWVMMLTGVFALITLGLQIVNNPFSKTFVLIALISGIISFGLMGRTAYLGGQIRHTEIRSNSTVVNNPANETNTSEQGDDD